ncbi:PocR ligand-binding domain-containing protein [Candidatus Amarolinea aalborgensis]|jgi:excisionase family DNA binding protein|uniref:PocR ligand-binding domain-containing protein n=1 Tax=Candidatus Amarolinea aalborgensis TaxID=2249329 RepID=UPI003BF95D7D
MSDMLTTRQVQEMLQVDRTTIYRFVESGQLPAVRVGKQWRFAQADIDRLLHKSPVAEASGRMTPMVSHAPPPSILGSARDHHPAGLAELLPLACAQMIQDTFAEALSVMMVITDMAGQPVTQVSHACGLYRAVIQDPEGVAHCIRTWQQLAGAPTLQPKFSASELGLLCARGLIRAGNELKGMVFIGGIAPAAWPPTSQEVKALAASLDIEPGFIEAHMNEVYYLDRAAQERALEFVQRIADVYSHILEDRQALTGRLQAIASLTTLS